MFTDTTGQAPAGTVPVSSCCARRTPRSPPGSKRWATTGSGRYDTGSRVRSVVDAFSADLMWVGRARRVRHRPRDRGGHHDHLLGQGLPHQPVPPVRGRRAPGAKALASSAARTATRSSRPDPCDTVPIDLVRGTAQGRDGPPISALRHRRRPGRGMHEPPPRALNSLIGFAMPSPARTIDLIVAGKLVRVDRRHRGRGTRCSAFLDHRLPGAGRCHPAAKLTAGLPAGAPGRASGW